MKFGNDTQTTVFYIGELAEHGQNVSCDPPSWPCVNPFWALQKMKGEKGPAPNMMQKTIQVTCNHNIILPDGIKAHGSKKQSVTVDFPVLVNTFPFEVGATLVLE